MSVHMLVHCCDVCSLVSVIVLMGVHMLVYCCDVGSLVSVLYCWVSTCWCTVVMLVV